LVPEEPISSTIDSPEKKKRKLSLSYSVVEPSIGDFGLIDNLESTRQTSPILSPSSSLIIKDQAELDNIIKRSSVLL
jgi:hypothetical protein